MRSCSFRAAVLPSVSRTVVLLMLTILFAGHLFAIPATPAPVQNEPTPAYAKNVIILISDGMGYFHVDAASYYQHGATGQQIYEQFPYQYGMTTYAVGGSYDPQQAWSDFTYVKSGATDSAAAGTAIATGVKTYNGAIGVDSNQAPLTNIVEHAESHGKATGVVSSVQLSHATPASFVAHNQSRGNYTDIANEMILTSAVDVIMGAGHPEYDATGAVLDSGDYNHTYVGGSTTWDALRAGTAGGDADGDGTDDPWTLIETKTAFVDLIADTTPPARVIGVPPVRKTLQYKRSGTSTVPYDVPFLAGVPSLEQMTRGALNVLDDDPDGLFLMVEGGAVDWAGHGNYTPRLIEEQIDFNNTVEAVVEWVEQESSWEETLVMVTADHETGYLTGPGAGSGPPPAWTPLVNNGQGALPGVQWNSRGHTNSLVPFYAKGAGASRFSTYVDGTDPQRGDYIDLTAIAKVAEAVMDVSFGSIIISQETVPQGTAPTWALEGTAPIGSFMLDSDDGDDTYPDQRTFHDLQPDNYTINTTGLPTDWNVSTRCVGSTGGSSITTTNETVTVDLAAGDVVECTFLYTQAVAPLCDGVSATIYVQNGLIIGGPDDGAPYTGTLTGTDGDDVIVGTPAADIIDGKLGDDLICGGNGNDTLVAGTRELYLPLVAR